MYLSGTKLSHSSHCDSNLHLLLNSFILLLGCNTKIYFLLLRWRKEGVGGVIFNKSCFIVNDFLVKNWYIIKPTTHIEKVENREFKMNATNYLS